MTRLTNRELFCDANVFRALNDSASFSLAADGNKLTTGLGVLFELIAGLPEQGDPRAPREFNARRSALRHWRDWITPARTIWLTPSDIRRRAFGVRVEETQRGPLQAIDLMLSSEDLTTFERRLLELSDRARHVPSLSFLRAERKRVHESFPTAMRFAREHFKTVTYAELEKKAIQERERTQTARQLQAYSALSGDSERYTLLALAEEAGVWDGRLPKTNLYKATVEVEQDVRKVYDGSVDLYIRAYSAYSARKYLQGGDAKTNDSLDLDLFAYLRPGDRSQLLVSGDRDVLDLCEFAEGNRSISIVELCAT